MHLVAVTDVEKAFFEEPGCSMRDHAVTLHFAESETTVTPTALCRLSSQDLSGSTATRMHFVLDHMLQALVIGRPKEDHHFHFLASEAIVHDFVTSHLVAQAMQFGRNAIDSVALAIRRRSAGPLERCSVTFCTFECCDLGRQALYEMTNGHA